jgi:hypothetical protein
MTDFRALCAELVTAWDSYSYSDAGDAADRMTQYVTEARAALAQPEPVAPTDEELLETVAEAVGYEHVPTDEICLALARAALARYGRPAIEPVPVSVRWPEFSDCNPFEAVWAFNPVLDHWKLTRINQSIHTHWLPHWALPLPGVEGVDA